MSEARKAQTVVRKERLPREIARHIGGVGNLRLRFQPYLFGLVQDALKTGVTKFYRQEAPKMLVQSQQNTLPKLPEDRFSDGIRAEALHFIARKTSEMNAFEV
jgi:hypothetical protein